MKVSKAALATMIALGATVATSLPAAAQDVPTNRQSRPGRTGGGTEQQQQQQPQQQASRLSRAEQAALVPLDTAIRAQDWAAAQAALPAAQAAARGDDARRFVALATWQIAVGTNNAQAEPAALEAVIAAPAVPQELLIRALNRQAELAFNRQDYALAERAFVRLTELEPANTQYSNNLGIVRRRMGNSAGALAPLLQQIQAGEAANTPAPEATYQRAIAIATEARQPDTVARLRQSLLQRYPTGANWRFAIDVYRQSAGTETQLLIDTFRLMRATGAMGTNPQNARNDYIGFAQLLNQAGLPGETKAVLDEGVRRQFFPQTDPGAAPLYTTANARIVEDNRELNGQIAAARRAATGRDARLAADALIGYGRFQEAAELYRLAGTKGGEDAGLIALRTGVALALAGNRAEAETTLRAVTGARQGLAQLWLTWLARSAS